MYEFRRHKTLLKARKFRETEVSWSKIDSGVNLGCLRMKAHHSATGSLHHMIMQTGEEDTDQWS